jgi:putative redox protein
MRSQKVSIESARGQTLAGVLDLPEGAPLAWALFAHCFSCSKDLRAAREIARRLCEERIGVLRFDFEGLGASEGEFSDTTFSSNLDDLVAAADFLRARGTPPSILIGHSLGGAAVIAAAARIPEARAVAVIGAPADARHVAHQFADRLDAIAAAGAAEVTLAGRPFVIRKAFLDDLERARVLDAAAALRRPLLIMHAPRDATVGVDNAARLFEAARHPKSFVSLDDADHLLSRPADARYAAGVLAAWAARYVGEGAESASRRPDASS